MEEEEEQDSCPYCKSDEDCKHLVAVTDPFNYGRFSLGGCLFEAEKEIYDSIIESMNRNKSELPKSIKENNSHLMKDFWSDWINEEELNADNFLSESSNSEIFEYLTEILHELNLYSSYESEFSSWTFYDENSDVARERFFQKLKDDLN